MSRGFPSDMGGGCLTEDGIKEDSENGEKTEKNSEKQWEMVKTVKNSEKQ